MMPFDGNFDNWSPDKKPNRIGLFLIVKWILIGLTLPVILGLMFVVITLIVIVAIFFDLVHWTMGYSPWSRIRVRL